MTALTKKQKEELPKFVKKWIKIGFDTTAANRKKTEVALKKAYKNISRPEPEHILWVNSPQAGHDLHCKLRHKKDWVTPFYGQHDASWLSFYDAVRSCGADIKLLDPLIELAENCGWIWMFEHGVICTERPTELTFNKRSKKSFSIKYPDGWSIRRKTALKSAITRKKITLGASVHNFSPAPQRCYYDKMSKVTALHIEPAYRSNTEGARNTVREKIPGASVVGYARDSIRSKSERHFDEWDLNLIRDHVWEKVRDSTSYVRNCARNSVKIEVIKKPKRKRPLTHAEEYEEAAERGELSKQGACDRADCDGTLYFSRSRGILGCGTCDYYCLMSAY